MNGAGVLAHVGIPGLAPFIAMALFLGGLAAGVGAYAVLGNRTLALPRPAGIALGVVAFGCFAVATAFPLIVHASPTFGRPSTRAHLAFLAPHDGEVFQGDPAAVPVTLRLDGGRVVSVSSLHLIPNEGHIHLYLDGSLVAMTGLDAHVSVRPGRHALRAEFVAVDHGPFRPRVLATVAFQVLP